MEAKYKNREGDTLDAMIDDLSQVIPIPLLIILVAIGIVGRILGYI